MKSIELKDCENLIIKLKPGLSTTGKIDLILLCSGIEQDIASVELEDGDKEIDITNLVISGKENFIGIYGKLFPLPGKQRVQLDIKVYSNGEEKLTEVCNELYCKIMIKLKT